MSFTQSKAAPRARLRQATGFRVEGLERRVLLSSAIAAFRSSQSFRVGPNDRDSIVRTTGKPSVGPGARNINFQGGAVCRCHAGRTVRLA
jgi:hypothetical protein